MKASAPRYSATALNDLNDLAFDYLQEHDLPTYDWTRDALRDLAAQSLKAAGGDQDEARKLLGRVIVHYREVHALATVHQLYVMPVDSETKVPRTRWGTGGPREKATIDPEVIATWFLRDHPLAGVGIAMKPSKKFALDGDPKNGFDGWDGVEEKVGPLPRTASSRTPSGSEHLIFDDPDGVGVNTTQVLAVGVDTKGAGLLKDGCGGYTREPPTGGLEWLVHPDDAGFAPMPEKLRKWCEQRRAERPEKSGKRGSSEPGGIGTCCVPRVTLDEFREVLRLLPVEAYNGKTGKLKGQFFEVMAALHWLVGGQPEYRGLFLAWCSGDEDYVEDLWSGSIAARWNSLHAEYEPGEGNTAGTVRHHLKALGKKVPAWLQVREWDKRLAAAAEGATTPSPEDFFYHLESGNFFYRPTRTTWVPSSVDARVPTDRASWKIRVDPNRGVHQVTWSPGDPELIEGRFIIEGGWTDHPGARIYNLYRPPEPVDGDAALATRWVDHVRLVYPEEAEHIIRWLAHRVQYPGVKINHGLFLGGDPGIGKDSLLTPVERAVGSWNFREISPNELLDEWTDYLQAVVLRISEARDMGSSEASPKNRYALYERLKTIAAAPPPVLRVNPKHIKQFSAPNVVGPVITSNYRDGLYLPANDRRWYVAWSPLADAGSLGAGYFDQLHAWYRAGGMEHVAAYLQQVDLSGFDPKAPPPRTEAFRVAVSMGRDPQSSVIADAIEELGGPDAVTVWQVRARMTEFEDRKLFEPGNRRRLPHLFGEAGFVVVDNPGTEDGRWKVAGKNQTIYAQKKLSRAEQLEAARALIARQAEEVRQQAEAGE